MWVEAYSTLFELGYTVDLLDIVFVLYCHCYNVKYVQSTGADLQICEKTSLYNSLVAKKNLQRLT